MYANSRNMSDFSRFLFVMGCFWLTCTTCSSCYPVVRTKDAVTVNYRNTCPASLRTVWYLQIADTLGNLSLGRHTPQTGFHSSACLLICHGTGIYNSGIAIVYSEIASALKGR